MVIGFDGSRAFISQKTGTENYSYQLLKALAKIDKANRYFVYTRPFISRPIDQLMKLPKNFKVVEIRWPRFWTQGGLAVQTFKDNLDVLFVPSHTLPIIRRPGLKTVITVHDLGSEYLPSMHQLKQRLYLGFMQKYQLNSATKIIAVSQATKLDLVKRIGIDPGKIKVVYEGYDQGNFKNQNSKVKIDAQSSILKYYELITNNYFLFVGTVQPRKNLERVISAFSRFIAQSKTRNGDSIEYKVSSIEGKKQKKAKPHYTLYTIPYTLVIAGSKGWLSNDIYKLPKKLGIEDRVKFLGYVPEKDLPALYSGAQALVFPSLFEGFGLPILEAQACGCPVVTSNVSSMPEVAGKGAIYVDPYSVDDIVDGMERVKGKAERVKLIKAGYENIKRFSWEKCAAQTLKVFEEL
ncbi:glycosyltransferase family 4 protein [Candidatus Daviesbacteria bacterium]|nr:glycosyltransferase family 4 protein [Candidatus Daviesbacteria bacterium]